MSLKGKFLSSIRYRNYQKGLAAEADDEENLIRRLRKQELVNRNGRKQKKRSLLEQEEEDCLTVDLARLEKHQQEIACAMKLVNEDLQKLFQKDYFQFVWGVPRMPYQVSFGSGLTIDTSPRIFTLEEMMNELSEELLL